MSDYVSRGDVLNALCGECKNYNLCFFGEGEIPVCPLFWKMQNIPATDVVERKSNKPKTNADRIRSMTDKELAVWLAGAMLYGEPLKVMRIADWEKWLKQESKEWNLT